jgi:hypothetical protein
MLYTDLNHRLKGSVECARMCGLWDHGRKEKEVQVSLLVHGIRDGCERRYTLKPVLRGHVLTCRHNQGGKDG